MAEADQDNSIGAEPAVRPDMPDLAELQAQFRQEWREINHMRLTDDEVQMIIAGFLFEHVDAFATWIEKVRPHATPACLWWAERVRSHAAFARDLANTHLPLMQPQNVAQAKTLIEQHEAAQGRDGRAPEAILGLAPPHAGHQSQWLRAVPPIFIKIAARPVNARGMPICPNHLRSF